MKKNSSSFKSLNKNARPSMNANAKNSVKKGPQRPAPPTQKESIPRNWRVVIGTHSIIEALRIRPNQVKGFWVRQGWEASADLRDMMDLAAKGKVKAEIKPSASIERFGPSEQGAALFLEGAPRFSIEKSAAKANSIYLILDGIEDPHNLGAIVRTSWLTGVDGVVIPSDRAVGLTPTVHKVACGGVEHVPVEETTNFAGYAEKLKEKGYWIFGLSPRGKKSVFELDLPEKVVWAIGSEDKGLRVNTERLCDELVYIPQSSASASYNASVATAMALTETLRQHATNSIPKKVP